MKKGWLYKLCVCLSIVLPLILLVCAYNVRDIRRAGDIWGYIVLGYILYWSIKVYVMKSGRSRMLHEIWILIFMAVLIRVYAKGFSFEPFIPVEFYSDEISLGIRISQIAICVAIIVAKILLLFLSNNDYLASSSERKRTRVEYDVEKARSEVEYQTKVGSYDAIEAAKMKLDRAKEKREKYYKEKGQGR